MRALTLHQPWATAMALGFKAIETRSWGTGYRGPLAIHAGKAFGWPAQFMTIANLLGDKVHGHHVDNPLHEAGYSRPAHYPVGAVLAIGTLADCRRIDTIPVDLDPTECAFGDFRVGRFMWKLEDLQRLEVPVPAVGHQGLWNWEPPQ